MPGPTTGLHLPTTRLYLASIPEIPEPAMRAEPQKLVDSINESLALLRRHL